MTMCKACGVELDLNMEFCPLCETSVNGKLTGKEVNVNQNGLKFTGRKKQLLQNILWQITAVLLLSGIIATFVIDLSVHGRITWSIYPVSICLIALSYASLMALWHTRVVFQVLAGWLASAMILMLVYWYFEEEWPVLLALPILSFANLIVILGHLIFKNLKTKGLNVLAITFVFIAVLCIVIEGTISLYFHETIRLQWSVIVTACLLPVTAAILFMYFRTRNNADLQKIFHT